MSDSILYITNNLDTTLNGDHVVITTFKSQDTIYVEKNIFHEEIKIIDKLIDRPDFGSSAVSVLIIIFVVYSIWKTRKKK